VLALEHYLDVLLRKPGALAGSLPLQQCASTGTGRRASISCGRVCNAARQAGWNPKHDRVVTAGSQHGWEKLKQAVRQALDIGCTDAAAVRHLLVFGELAHAAVERLAVGGLERYERPLPVMSNYDLLLDEVAECAMKPATEALEHASVKQYCKALRMPVIGANFVPLAEQAVKEKRNHIGYLEALLAMESEERDRHAVQHAFTMPVCRA